MGLMEGVYRATANFPSQELFGLVSQMRRAAVSIPSNIAEGAARDGKREFAHFLSIARGSISELDTQLQIAIRLGYLKQDSTDLVVMIERASKLISGLHRKMKEDANT